MSKMLLMIFLMLGVSSCQSVPDFASCADLGNEGHCRRFNSKKLETYNDTDKLYRSKLQKKTYKWSDVPKVSIPIDEFVPLKNFLDNFCHQNPSRCPGQAGDWNTVANELVNKLEKKK